jgi:hypothetical protein
MFLDIDSALMPSAQRIDGQAVAQVQQTGSA